MLKSRRALMLSGALGGLIRPLLAADAKLDIGKMLEGVNEANLGDRSAKLASDLVSAATPQLAADKTLNLAAVTSTIEAVRGMALDAKDDVADDADPDETADDADPDETADDEDDADAGNTAMDAAAVRSLIDKTRRDTLAEAAAIRTAEREVAPYVGEVVAMDSAEAVYRHALKALKVDATGITGAAGLRSLLKLVPAPAGDDAPLALDHAAIGAGHADFQKRYGLDSSRLVRS